MKIENHLIPGGLFQASPNIGGALIKPTLLVMHYTAGAADPESAARYLCKPAVQASAHIVLGEDGRALQIVPFDRKAWHAGKSTWRAKSNCNDFSIGIEICNWGLLSARADGSFRSHSGVEVSAGRVVHAKNKRGIDGYWLDYPQPQLEALDVLTAAILEAYPTIKEVVGHEDIAPGRKIDPGPAFPLDRYAGLVGGGRKGLDVVETRRVTATLLNVRSQPDTSADIVEQIAMHQEVEIIYDAGAWSQIKTKRDTVGWVYDQYLA